jgi:hypothetical protein
MISWKVTHEISIVHRNFAHRNRWQICAGAKVFDVRKIWILNRQLEVDLLQKIDIARQR